MGKITLSIPNFFTLESRRSVWAFRQGSMAEGKKSIQDTREETVGSEGYAFSACTSMPRDFPNNSLTSAFFDR